MANFHDTPPHLPSQDPRAWHEPMPKHPPMTQSFVYPAGHIFASPNQKATLTSLSLLHIEAHATASPPAQRLVRGSAGWSAQTSWHTSDYEG